jgi:hypothetical protein
MSAILDGGWRCHTQKVGQPKIFSAQISEQKILKWFFSHNMHNRYKLDERKISQKNADYMLNYSLLYNVHVAAAKIRLQIKQQ